MHKDLFIRICWCCATLLLLVALTVRLSVLSITPYPQIKEVMDFIYDDGYYYLAIAANVADLGRSTLDGITATNGYQPLWLLLLSGLARLVGTEPWRFFIASCAFIYAIAAAGSLSVIYWWRDKLSYIPLCMAAGMAIVAIQQPGVFLEGLEPILVVPLVIPLIVLLEREATPKTLLWLSAVLSSFFLVRLDALALFCAAIVGIPLAEMATGRRPIPVIIARSFAVALRLSLIVIPTVLVYAALNQWLFDSPVPVSGLAKLMGGAKFGNWGIIEMFFNRWHSCALLLVIAIPLELIARMSALKPEPVFYRSLLIVVIALLLQCFYYAAFSAWNVWPWYAYLFAVTMALIIARIIYLGSLLCTQSGTRIAAISAVIILGAWAANRSATFTFRSLPSTTQAKFGFVNHLLINAGPGAATTSYNQMSLSMLNDFFPSTHHTTIAMGDRAGGIAYWGRNKLSVVQAEGLTLDAAYLKARTNFNGEQYFATRFPIEYWVIDREFIPTTQDSAGQIQYVVPDPIQGRITTAPVPTFCFPESAIRYKKTYASSVGNNTRMAFAFAERIPCTNQSLAMIRAAEQGMGLRQFSLPSEYVPSLGGTMNKHSEDRDRHYRTQP